MNWIKKNSRTLHKKLAHFLFQLFAVLLQTAKCDFVNNKPDGLLKVV